MQTTEARCSSCFLVLQVVRSSDGVKDFGMVALATAVLGRVGASLKD